MKKYKEIIRLAQKAFDLDCVPVGAIVVCEDKIIGRGYNKKEKTNNPLDHAEITAIKKAVTKMKTWKLDMCELYVTMEPCMMCKSVIREARIKKVYFLIENKKEQIKNKKTEITQINEQMYAKNYLGILRGFFLEKRKKTRKIL